MSYWRRTQAEMRRDAETLISFLEDTFVENPHSGWRLYPLAQRLGWTNSGIPDTNKVKATIAWCRNNLPVSRGLIVYFKVGREHAYKIPTEDQAIAYLAQRGKDVAVRSSHILFLTRKQAARFGVTAQTRRSTAAYTEVLRWLSQAGVEDADALLQEALRPLANGRAA